MDEGLAATGPFAPFTISLDVRVRPCREQDLPTLEWFGLFEPHRALIRSTFERQQRGDALMLIAEANGVASGQAWVELPPRGTHSLVGLLWAVRVFPCLQRLGIGSRLIAAAERALVDRGVEWAQLSVEPDNVAARRLYERAGYRMIEQATRQAESPATEAAAAAGQWVLWKQLAAGRAEAADASGRLRQ